MPTCVIEIVFEIVIEIGKPCSTSTMQKIVIEIVIEIMIEFCSLTEIGKNISNRTNTAIFYVTGSTVQKIGRAAQSDF